MRVTAQNWLRITPIVVVLLVTACGTGMDVEGQETSLTLDAGTELQVEPLETLSPTTEQTGDEFTATLARPLMKGSEMVAPQGSTVVGEIVGVVAADPGQEGSALSLQLNEIRVAGGQTISIETETLQYSAGNAGQYPGSEPGQEEGSIPPLVPEERVLTFRLARSVDVPVAADQGSLPPISRAF